MSWRVLPWVLLFAVVGCDDGGGVPGDAADGVDAEGGDVGEAADEAGDVLDVLEEAEAEAETEDPFPPPSENWERDVLHVGLAVDATALSATATIVVAAGTNPGVSFEAGGLIVVGVTGPGGPYQFALTGGRLDVGVPAAREVTFEVQYEFAYQADFEGYSRRDWTLTWPDHCGNLFPCRSQPAEGQTFSLEVTGVPAGRAAVYPTELAEAPAYQIAWAIDDFVQVDVGTTSAGTQVVGWAPRGREGEVATGMADVPAVFDWYERTLGAYPFGARVGAVAVQWPSGAGGGMEHHPYWHVARGSMTDRGVHVHEAAHGWYGDGVRIARWEDLVLSEGTACYLAARALGQAVDAAAEAALWTSYDTELNGLVAGRDALAWPDPFADPAELDTFRFSRVPYMKGAFFFRAVATSIGAAELDRILGLFFATHVGEAAGMQDLLDLIHSESGFDPAALADGWLRSLGRPDV